MWASDEEISIGDLVQKIGMLMGKSVKVASDRQRLRPQNSEVERLWADNRKARDLIGWAPQTTLDDGLASNDRVGYSKPGAISARSL